MPKVSFCIPAHNCAAWLPFAVESCFKQTHKDIEIVIVDDGSIDTTQDYLSWLLAQPTSKGVVKVIVNSKPFGRSTARNMANEEATGDILCVLDADDMNAPNRAKLMVDKFKTGAQFVYGSAVFIDALSQHVGQVNADSISLDKALERMENGIVHSTCAYTKGLAKRFPYMDGEISDLGIDDWNMQIRVLAAGIKMDFCPQTLSAYRMLGTGISKTRDQAKVLEAKKRVMNGLLVPATC